MSNIRTTACDVMITEGIEPAINVWLDRLRDRAGRRPETIKTYLSVMKNLTNWNHGQPILYLTGEDLGRWMDHLAASGRDESTRRVYLGVSSGYYAWAIQSGLIHTDPTADIPRPKARRRLPRPISEGDLQKAMQLTTDPSMRVMLALGALAGLRACEVAGLDWRDVVMDDDDPHLTVIGKGGHERVVPVSPELAEILLALPHRTGPVIRRRDGKPGHYCPDSVSHLVGDHMRQLGLRWRLHSTRHRFGTVAYECTGDLRAVQELMGHFSPSTTALYTQVSGRSRRAAVLAAGQIRAKGRKPAERSCRKPHPGAAS